jgi:hypothetical protein
LKIGKACGDDGITICLNLVIIYQFIWIIII